MENQSTQPTTTPVPQPNPPETPPISKVKKISKALIIVLVLLFLTTTGTAGYFAYQNYQTKKQTSQLQPSLLPITTASPTTNTIISPTPSPITNPIENWQPPITIDEWYWSNEDWFSVDQHQSVVDFANNYISQKVGIDYFNQHFQFDTHESSVSRDGNFYYLRYDLFIPSKGLAEKTTTHPTSFYFQFKKSDNQITLEKDGLSEITPNDIAILKQEAFIDKNQALNIAKAYIQKNFPLPEKVLIDFEIFSWRIRYEIPKELSPQCEFGMGAQVTLFINTLTREVSEQIDCNFPGT